MAIPSAGIFNALLARIGATVSRTPVTRTLSNSSGRESFSTTTAVNITAVVGIKDKSWAQDEIAKLEGYDGYIMVSTSTTINEYDRITVDSKVYEVRQLYTQNWTDGNSIHKHGFLMLRS